MAKRESRIHKKGSAGNNRNISEDFLKKNKNKPDVITTQTGLQYTIIEATNYIKPETHHVLRIHQRALLLSGAILIDTYKQNYPEEVIYNELIEGLKEGILLMPKGSRFKFWVPPELAWGKKGTYNSIPPYAVLIFDIRLLDFY